MVGMHAIVGWQTPNLSPISLPCQKWAPCKVKVILVYTARARIGPPSANHGPFTASPSSYHLHSSLQVTPPSSPCPTISADTEPLPKRSVWCNQKCNIGFKRVEVASFGRHNISGDVIAVLNGRYVTRLYSKFSEYETRKCSFSNCANNQWSLVLC